MRSAATSLVLMLVACTPTSAAKVSPLADLTTPAASVEPDGRQTSGTAATPVEASRLYALDLAYSSQTGSVLLGRTCQAETSCTTWIRIGQRDGRAYPRSAQRDVFTSPAEAAVDDPSTLSLSAGRILVSSPNRSLVSEDQGQTWQPAPGVTAPGEPHLADPPCRGADVSVARRENEVWVDCQDESPPGQPGRLFVSTDEGAHWQAKPLTPSLRYHAQLTLLGRGAAFLYNTGRSSVLRTIDAGRTWREALPYLENGYARVVAGAPRQAYALIQDAPWAATGAGVERYDGSRWTRIAIPT